MKCATIYEGHPDQRWGPTTYAQHADDMMLVNLFELIGIDKPSYLDCGAHHPTNISNTRLLYERGSRGVNVDANPYLIEEFNRQRPGDINMHVGVGPVTGFFDFHMYDNYSGRNTFSAAETKAMEGVLTVREVKQIPVITINQVVESKCPGGRFPDLLLLDIEGMDFSVLDSADFYRFGSPKVICVETRRESTPAMQNMLAMKGVGYFQYCRCGENAIFVQDQLKSKVY